MTDNSASPFSVDVTGHEALQIRNNLNSAVDQAVSHALQDGKQGVLVTQHSYTLYTVALSQDVPYGQIHEKRNTPDVAFDRNAGPNVLG